MCVSVPSTDYDEVFFFVFLLWCIHLSRIRHRHARTSHGYLYSLCGLNAQTKIPICPIIITFVFGGYNSTHYQWMITRTRFINEFKMLLSSRFQRNFIEICVFLWESWMNIFFIVFCLSWMTLFATTNTRIVRVTGQLVIFGITGPMNNRNHLCYRILKIIANSNRIEIELLALSLATTRGERNECYE